MKSKKIRNNTTFAVSSIASHNYIIHWIVNFGGKFAINDIVNIQLFNGSIRMDKRGRPVRYKVVHVDQHGLPYLRKILRKRGLSRQTYSVFALTEYSSLFGFSKRDQQPIMDYYGRQKFNITMDEGYLTSILLGEKFDPRK